VTVTRTFSTASLVAFQALLFATAPDALGADAASASEPAARADASKDSGKDRPIQPNDKLTISLDGLDGPGRTTVFKLVVDEQGRLKLPYLKEPIAAKGLTREKLQAAINKAYDDAGLIQNANSNVDVLGKDADAGRVVRPKDRLTISIRDLESPGKETIIKAVVDDGGKIALPYVKDPIRAKDLTCNKIEEAVVAAYRDAQLINDAVVKVVIATEPKP
jgi:protein involved in polysaccharide export with SLBB domain